ncbi:MAG: hypothetical protein ABSG69_10030 [Candidatus Acidiferrum sp.]
MNIWKKLGTASALGLLLAGAASADTLELKDGRVLQGRFLGGTQAVMRFEWNGEVKTFSVNDIVALTFTPTYHEQDNAAPPSTPPSAPPQASAPGTSSAPTQAQAQDPQNPSASTPPPPADTPNGYSADAPPAPQTPSAPAAAPAPAPAPAPRALVAGAPPAAPIGSVTPVTLQPGQSVLIRMIDGVDSKKNNVGDVFHASLETDLTVNGILVARRGTDVYGKLAYAKEAGHFAGSAELELELTRMVIDGTDYPLVSDDYTLKGKGRGGDTAKKVGGGAILGAIIGGIAGGGAGAAVGAGVGSAAGAGVQVFTRGKEVKVPSETLLEFRLQQPATVNATAH